MFGLFHSAKDIEHLKCRRCRHKIGTVEHYPIPVCAQCWLSACENRVSGPGYNPNKDSFQSIMQDFDAEARVWVKRLQTRPTRIDVLRDSSEAMQEVWGLGHEVDAAYQKARTTKVAADAVEADRLQEVMNARMQSISENRPEAMAAADAVEREE